VRLPLQPNRTSGKDPDYRQTFANERTFLAWIRTSLALVAGGLALVGLLPQLSPEWARDALGVLLVITGLVLAVASLVRWVRSEDAMRVEGPLPRSWLPVLTVASVAVVCVIVVALLLAGTVSAP
jgi:putative membrane protein